VLLAQYPGNLASTLTGILKYGCQIGYIGPLQHIISKNLKSSMLDPTVIKRKLSDDLALGRVLSTRPEAPFICSPLGLVPKHDGGFRRIHHLSHPRESSVNWFIPENYSKITYISIRNIFTEILATGRSCVIIKKDIKDAFRNIPIAPPIQWILGFSWNREYYKEACLPFGLATAPFLFNLFAEGFHWILESWLQWNVFHYLDDFIRIIHKDVATSEMLAQSEQDYHRLTALLGIPENNSKDVTGTIVTVLGIEIDTNMLVARLPTDKLAKARDLTSHALRKASLSLVELQSLAGFLAWCAEVTRLGHIYLHHIWDFERTFPTQAPSTLRRKIPYNVRQDLCWWNALLPNFNGVLLFHEDRETFQLYSDASCQGLGAYFSIAGEALQEHSFAMRIAKEHQGQHINVLELRAIQAAFYQWSSIWSKKKIVVNTDSELAYWALTNHKAHGVAFYPLRHILLLASQHDIILSPHWIPGKTNQIADALSRFNFKALANLCPTWQLPYLITSFPTGFKDLSPPPHMFGRNSSTSASAKAPEITTSHTKSNIETTSVNFSQDKSRGRQRKLSFAPSLPID
jgi:hypothetical protein